MRRDYLDAGNGSVTTSSAPRFGSHTYACPASSVVTRPAMAIPEAHDFPALPQSYAHNKNIAVRLILSVARDGSIAGAQIAQTSGADVVTPG